MTYYPPDFPNMPLGIYRLYWSEEPLDLSVAAVGCDASGARWYAPTNWIWMNVPSTDWGPVVRAELVTTQRLERMKMMPPGVFAWE